MLDYFIRRTASAKDDLLSGITVALALVPEAIAFAFVAGVSPLIGLYSAFFIGLITAVVGGRPGMISGATGAMAVVVTPLVAEHGVAYLFPAVILCGLIQIAVGLLRLGMFIRMVPHSVMLGFVNGLAIVIFMAQFGSFKTLGDDGTLTWITGAPLAVMLALVALTMAIIWLLPKFTRAVPSSLAAILVVAGLAAGVNAFAPDTWRLGGLAGIDNATPTVRDMLAINLRAEAVREADDAAGADQRHAAEEAAELAGLRVVPVDAHGGAHLRLSPEEAAAAAASVPADAIGLSGTLPLPFFLEAEALAPVLPANFVETLTIIWPFAVILAGVGLIESLMTLTLIDEITETRGRGNKECVGQGVANVTCGFFGGMGGCAMIGQSLINVNSGGRGRLSGITAAVCLLLFVLALSPWIEQIPMAALVGVMFMVVIGTFEWASLKMWRKVPTADILVMLLVTLYTVFMHDLATAVLLGVAVSALVFAWNHATHIGADVQTFPPGEPEDDPAGDPLQPTKSYQLHGPLFFASVPSFKEMFNAADDPPDIVIDFYYSRVYDQSAIEAINQVTEKYAAAGKTVHLKHLSPECQALLDRASDLVEVNVSEDPHYHVASERLG